MFTWLSQVTPIVPAGRCVFSGRTVGATARFRADVPVEIWHDGTYSGSYRVFVAGRFLVGMRTEEQAIAYATQF